MSHQEAWRAGMLPVLMLSFACPAGAVLRPLQQPAAQPSAARSTARAQDGSVPRLQSTADLLSCWQGEGNADDSCGTNTGRWHGSPSYTSGAFGQAFEFDGDSYVRATTLQLPAGHSDRSLALWFRIDTFVDYEEVFLAGYGNFGHWAQTYQIGGAGGRLFFSQWGLALSGPEVQTKRWYHVVTTNEGGRVRFYLNGELVATQTLDLERLRTPTDGQFVIGGVPGSLGAIRKLRGAVDEVAVYRGALSDGVIKQMYEDAVARNPGLASHGEVPRPAAARDAVTLTTAQQPVDKGTLEAGKAAEWELMGGQTHVYRVRLEAGWYVSVVVEQKFINVQMTLFGPDHGRLLEVDTPYGIERIAYVVVYGGDYLIEVRSLMDRRPAQPYEVRLEQAHLATQRDREFAHDLTALARLDKDVASAIKSPGSDSDAIPKAFRALAIVEKAFGPDDRRVAPSLNNLATLYLGQRDYRKAEPLFERALAVSEKALGPTHPDVATALDGLANLNYVRGTWMQAAPLHERALAIQERALPPDHPNLLETLNNLALVYKDLGEAEKGGPLLERVCATVEKLEGPDNPAVAQVLDNLAGNYLARGAYAKAEPVCKRSLAIYEGAFGPDHVAVSWPLNTLASLYWRQGAYDKAQPLFERALAIREKGYGPEDKATATSLGNLALLHRDRGDYWKAEPLLVRALEITEKALGPEHYVLGLRLHHLATVYSDLGAYEKAEPLFERALAIDEKALGPDALNVGRDLFSLATIHMRRGAYGKAEPLFERSLAIREKSLGADDALVASTLSGLATLFSATGEVQKAVAYQARANAVIERDLARNLVSGSEQRKLEYLARNADDLDRTVSLHVRQAPADPIARSLAFEVIIRRKGRALDATIDQIAVLRRHVDPKHYTILDELGTARSLFAALRLRGPGSEGSDAYRMKVKAVEERIEALENEVASRSAEFRAQSTPITLDSVRNALPAGAALVEFAEYRPFDPRLPRAKAESVPARFVVYVQTAEGEPQWVELGDAVRIDAAVSAFRLALRDPSRADVREKARALDELVMRPVRALVGETRQLLIAPDGALNLVPLAALEDEHGRYLVERFSISYLTSGRDLLRMMAHVASRSAPLVLANPTFTRFNDVAATRGASFEDIRFRALPASENEARSIERLLPGARVLIGGRATEAALRDAAGPEVLHLATHGFFVGVTADQPLDDARAFDGLLRSGIALAGANRKDDVSVEDGLMTAFEFASLDLWGTKLVVLSACDTGLGEVRAGEGVYGLRRAMVLAGSETQMMSLWDVDDLATRELMISYYTELLTRAGRADALRRVQLRMLKDPKRRHPAYWASFIVSGDWRPLNPKEASK